MSDALADAKAAMNRLLRILAMRGAGLALVLAAFAALLALVSYSADDASLNNANLREAGNWLGPLGAVAADLLLQIFGLAAVAFLAPLFVWGARALRGKSLKYAMWRLLAWPLGTVTVAAGFGLLPPSTRLPAGDGGLIGIAAGGLSVHAAQVWHTPVLSWALPLGLLLVGLPLAFLATGLRFMPIARGIANIPAGAIWLAGLIKRPHFHHHDDDDDGHEYEDEDEGAYHLDDDEPGAVAPEPIAAARLAERQKSRVKRDNRAAQPRRAEKQPALNLANGEYQLPSLDLLAESPPVKDTHTLSDEALEENARMLEAVLSDFGVKGRISAVRPGPVVTLYEFEPAAGVKSSRVISLSDDVARSMSAVAARIATISGRNVIGIELPNQFRETVFLREMFASPDYEKARAPLTLALGKTIGGEPVMADLAKMPHLLVAGTTGSGKSVGLNTMILSLLFRMSPQACRLIMIDPKMLELSVYDGIPHLLSPVVTDPRKAVVALKWAVREMEDRYRKMSKMGVRGVEAFNERVRKAKDKGEVLKRTVQTGFDRETGKPIYEDENLEFEAMPYIVVVVDEVADLMMISGKEIEGAVQRLAQMARAAGIHLI
ncbi:MAG TPA: DNA translocase FtsK 4TM domain-containing protein, partial [Rhizomicrobium sp.]